MDRSFLACSDGTRTWAEAHPLPSPLPAGLGWVRRLPAPQRDPSTRTLDLRTPEDCVFMALSLGGVLSSGMISKPDGDKARDDRF